MEVTIEITQYCPYDCWYCSSMAGENGKHLSTDEIKEFLTSAADTNEITRINISGGEPLAHPDFYKIKVMCDSIVGSKNVYVYTNAIEKLMFNANVITGVQVHANICVFPGKEFRIPMFAHVIHLLKLVRQGRAKDTRMLPDQEMKVSGNYVKGSQRCKECQDEKEHLLLQADGNVTTTPCRKDYR